MAFVHCHECGWSQDDFWSEHYNPITFLEENYTKELLTADLDEVMEMDPLWIEETEIHIEDGARGPTRREMIAWELEKHAQTIRNMEYRTFAELKEKNPQRLCPSCGGVLDID